MKFLSTLTSLFTTNALPATLQSELDNFLKSLYDADLYLIDELDEKEFKVGETLTNAVILTNKNTVHFIICGKLLSQSISISSRQGIKSGESHHLEKHEDSTTKRKLVKDSISGGRIYENFVKKITELYSSASESFGKEAASTEGIVELLKYYILHKEEGFFEQARVTLIRSVSKKEQQEVAKDIEELLERLTETHSEFEKLPTIIQTKFKEALPSIEEDEAKKILENTIALYRSASSLFKGLGSEKEVLVHRIFEGLLIEYIEKRTQLSFEACRDSIRTLSGEKSEEYENNKNIGDDFEQELKAEKSLETVKKEQEASKKCVTAFYLIKTQNPAIADTKEFHDYSEKFHHCMKQGNIDDMKGILKHLKTQIKQKDEIILHFEALSEFALPQEKSAFDSYLVNFLNDPKNQEINHILDQLRQRQGNPLRKSLPEDFLSLKSQLAPLFSEDEIKDAEQNLNNLTKIFDFESAKIMLATLQSELETRKSQHLILSAELSRESSQFNEKIKNFLGSKLKSEEYKEINNFLTTVSEHHQRFMTLQDASQSNIEDLSKKIQDLKNLRQELETKESKELASLNAKIIEDSHFLMNGYLLEAKKCCYSITQLEGNDEKSIRIISHVTQKYQEINKEIRECKAAIEKITQGSCNTFEKTKLLLELKNRINSLEKEIRLLQKNTKSAIHIYKQMCFGHVKLILTHTLSELSKRIEKYQSKLKNGIESTQKKYDTAFSLRQQMQIFKGDLEDTMESAQQLSSQAKQLEETYKPEEENLMLNVHKIKASFVKINAEPFKKAASTGKVFDYMTTNDQNFFNTFEKNMKIVAKEVEILSKIQSFC